MGLKDIGVPVVMCFLGFLYALYPLYYLASMCICMYKMQICFPVRIYVTRR